MPLEPASPTIVGTAIAAGTITVTGSIFGFQYDYLLAGFFGGLVSLSYLPEMTKLKIASTVATSSLFAAFFANVLLAASVEYLPWLKNVPHLGVTIAATLGLCSQCLIPLIFKLINKRGETMIGGDTK